MVLRWTFDCGFVADARRVLIHFPIGTLTQDNSAIKTRQVSDASIQEVSDFCRLRFVRLCFAALVKTIRRGNS
jgi:hypothetical protein